MTETTKTWNPGVADFTAYAVGWLSASVCTSLPRDELLARMNAEHPAGTEYGWQVSSDPTFRQGAPNPCPCHDHPETHQHWLLEC